MTTDDRDVQHQSDADHSRSEEAPRQVDPVCGMEVDPNATTVERIDRKGATYYFCSADCRRQFEASPEQYAA
jgi:YHS domain-containing protein